MALVTCEVEKGFLKFGNGTDGKPLKVVLRQDTPTSEELPNPLNWTPVESIE